MSDLISWDIIMENSLKLPFIKVNRDEYLKGAFSSYGDISDLSNKRPIDVFDEKIIEKVANATINKHVLGVTSTSAVAGIPGGFAMLGTIPADITQYYYHVILVSQKLGYIYGWPDLLDEKQEFSETSRNVLTLFVGVMLGAGAANKAVTEIGQKLSTQVAKRLPQQALTKTAYYPIIKQVGKWIGLKVTKESFAKGASKIVPVLGGVLSGGLTFFTFKPMANKLQKQLKEDASLHQFYGTTVEEKMNFTDSQFDNAEYEELDEREINLEYIKFQCLINTAKIDFEINEQEVEFISLLMDNSDLTEDEKIQLLEKLHSKNLDEIDFSEFKNNELYGISLLESLASLILIDENVKPLEKMYFYKIARELGFSKEDVSELLLHKQEVESADL